MEIFTKLSTPKFLHPLYVYEAQLNALFFENLCQILNITKLKKKPWFVILKLNFFKEKKDQAQGVAMGYCRAMVWQNYNRSTSSIINFSSVFFVSACSSFTMTFTCIAHSPFGSCLSFINKYSICNWLVGCLFFCEIAPIRVPFRRRQLTALASLKASWCSLSFWMQTPVEVLL